MIKIYSMNTCPDCIYVEEQIQGDDRYEIIDIGSHVKYLKEFLRIRDNSPVFLVHCYFVLIIFLIGIVYNKKSIS